MGAAAGGRVGEPTMMSAARSLVAGTLPPPTKPTMVPETPPEATTILPRWESALSQSLAEQTPELISIVAVELITIVKALRTWP